MAAKLCNVCNIRRPKTGSKGTETSPHADMCNYCFEEGGQENGHSDGSHEQIADLVAQGDNDIPEWAQDELEFMATCWLCHPELNLAKLPAQTAATGTKAQGTRRAQLNHKGHSHPGTPAARRACKKAFWGTYPTPTPAEFLEWDCKVDGFGIFLKEEPKMNITPMTIVATGPKGGVVKQLKAAKPSK